MGTATPAMADTRRARQHDRVGRNSGIKAWASRTWLELLLRPDAACVRALGDQTAAALVAQVYPQPVEDNAQPVAQADQEINVRKAPDPPSDCAAQLDPTEIDDGQPLADRRQATSMPVMKCGNCRVAAEPAPYDHRNVAPLLFCGR